MPVTALVVALALAADGGLEGMVLVPAGVLTRGRDHGPRADERPRHEVKVSSFWMDETLVTVEAFERFVAATNHRTSAERKRYGMVGEEGLPDWKWRYTPGATWRAPFGPDAGRPPRDDEPVTMVSWHDAQAYCAYLGKRLPTEAEWEHAMRAGSEGTRFPWGDGAQLPDGGAGLNFWQGRTHLRADSTDGYLYLSPVRAFPPNALGLYDPVGNVWQLVEDWYAHDTYPRAAAQGVPLDPRGPDGGTLKVLRGGSWWCSAHTCQGYGLHYRGRTLPSSAFNNQGFRCVRDASASPSP